MKRLVLLLVSLLVIPAVGEADDVTLLISGGRVIVGDGTVLEPGYVAVAGERIAAVSAEPIEAPRAQRIDATGKSVLPGLIDTHVHLTMEHLFEQPREDAVIEEFLAERLPERLRGFLEAGITTVMSPGEFWPFILDVRQRVRSGEIAGPRILTAGKLLTGPNGHPVATFCGFLDIHGPNPWCREHLASEVATESEARQVVAGLADAGVDLVKFVYDATDGPGVGVLDGDLVDDIVAAAHARELRAYAHILEIPKALEAIEAGLDGLVHLPAVPVEEAAIETLVAAMRERRVPASTTLVTWADAAEILARQGDETTAAALEGLLEGMRRVLPRLVAADPGLVALGTDTPHLPASEAYHREVSLVSVLGISPRELLGMATRNAAEYIGLGTELGTLEPGKLADVVIVDGDPLRDLSALQRVVAVVQGGRVVVSD